MFERKLPRVKQLPGRDVTGQFSQAFVLALAIRRVSHDGITKVFEVYPDLMGASSVQIGFDARGAPETFAHAIGGAGVTTIVVRNGHALSMRGMPANCGANFPFVARDFAANDRLVNLFHRAPGKLFREREMGRVVFGNDQATAGLAVQSVDNPRPCDPADPAELPRNDATAR